ncbi:MAG: cupin domain-containing protein [Actinomycetota bacterium]|nr:cupin domain-containing protein [Actinomycetota bacterium]MDQ3356202.1 cupin domain-containing protein [Actinomycetota bacterium]
MGARVEKASGGPAGPEEIRARFEEEDLRPHEWGNGPAYEYGWHSHSYHKVLYCLSGSIVFHTNQEDLELEPGDRMEVDPGTEHAATVGPDGVKCMEAAR